MEGGENHEPPRFCIEVNVPVGGWKPAVLRLHQGATLQIAVEVTVDIHFYFYEIHRGGWASPSSSEEPPLPCASESRFSRLFSSVKHRGPKRCYRYYLFS